MRKLNKKQKGGAISNTGYLPDSPDRHNDFNIIPGNNITMKKVKHKVLGIDNKGNQQMMHPGYDYTFPGDYVTEIPVKQMGGPSNIPAPIDSAGRATWNGYVDYLKSKNLSGSPKMNNVDFSKQHFNEYTKANQLNLDYDGFIGSVQGGITDYRNQAISQIKAGKASFNGNPDTDFMPGLSKLDSIAGERTTSWKFPDEKMKMSNGPDKMNSVYSSLKKPAFQFGGVPDITKQFDFSNLDAPGYVPTVNTFGSGFEYNTDPAPAAEQDVKPTPKNKSINDYLKAIKTMSGKASDNIMDAAINPTSAINMLGYGATIADHFDNRRKEKYMAERQRNQFSSDGYFPATGANESGNRGNYVTTGSAYGLFRPDEMGAKSPDGMYNGMYYPQMKMGGSKKNCKYEEGGQYSVTAEEVQAIMAAGGEIEFI